MDRFDPWRRYREVMGVLFVPAVVVFLVAAGVAWALNDLGLYSRGFEKYGVSRATGITPAGLHDAGAAIRGYFNSPDEPLVVRSVVYGEEREIFSEKEVHHMRDVKGLVRGVYLVGGGALVYILGVIIGGFAGAGASFTRDLARLLLWSGGATLAALVVFGAAAAIAFPWLFWIFHLVSFSNDLWLLDPRTDYLLIMFPLGFWFDATMRVAATAAAGAIALIAGSAVTLVLLRRRDVALVEESLPREAPAGDS